MTVLGMLLASAAAFGFAYGAWLQHAGVRGMTSENDDRLRLRNILLLLRERQWLFGAVVLAGSAGVHAIALGIAPITVVQPIGVLTLAVTVVLNARLDRVKLGKRTVWAVIAVTAGIIVFAPVAALHTSTTPVPISVEIRTAQIVGVLLVVLGLLGTFSRGRVRCLAFAVGAGIAYGMVSVFVRPLFNLLFTTGISFSTMATALGMAVAGIIGLIFIQQAYASGPAAVVVACITVFDPVLAVGVGVALLQEASLAATWMLVAESIAATSAIVGVVVLAAWHPESAPQSGTSSGRGTIRGGGSRAALTTGKPETDSAGLTSSELNTSELNATGLDSGQLNTDDSTPGTLERVSANPASESPSTNSRRTADRFKVNYDRSAR